MRSLLFAGLRAPLLVFSLLALVHGVHATETNLVPGEKFCMREIVPEHSRMSFQFFVTGPPDPKIGATVHDQNNKELMKWDSTGRGVYETRAKDGIKVLSVCFENDRSHKQTKRVVFHLRFHVDYDSVTSESQLDPLEEYIDNISDRMRDVELLQGDLQRLQREHINVVKKADRWLVLWGIFQAFALILTGLFQLYFLKRFLERKSFV
ncbi:putative emp24 gp25L p24 family GOLD [Trypanosoma vivax]|uniref:GOLD domain-containing protein n=1 Tax=Trypanosoma vivax (strain Y486) TaxID=1055687 RepID=G0TZV6_TRYVY|nr:hypothetical protein TRVL_04897 [Trypanosoma vivax]KAH8611064.1 putative emp24 gp25L p24 family GOLD [Trypanosoma vivax]CCC50134.1 conserved hypothetical protein [Trypanosoma vivax Y486]